jgi:phosphoglycolate phosphatase/pyrophosphatase PpaX
MLKYPCLILDHDDTVVQSEATINYPYFCYILSQFRPGETISLQEYIHACCHQGFARMCRERYHFTDAEMAQEYEGWKTYIKEHAPSPYPGIDRIIQRQKAEGGILCVVSHSGAENIVRDYTTNFGILPDEIYGWDLPEEQRKPNPYPLESIMQKYNLSPNQLLVVDDMKPAYDMAQKVGVEVAFAKWSKTEQPDICKQMSQLCAYTFENTLELENFLFV